MVIVAKVRPEMRVVNAAPLFGVLIVALFLFHLFVVLVSMFILGIRGHCPSQKERSANPTDR
jgi:hypothetical protein